MSPNVAKYFNVHDCVAADDNDDEGNDNAREV